MSVSVSVSVSVVLSLCVVSAMECRMRDNEVPCAVSLSGTMWSATSVQLEKNASGGKRKPSGCGPKHCTDT